MSINTTNAKLTAIKMDCIKNVLLYSKELSKEHPDMAELGSIENKLRELEANYGKESFDAYIVEIRATTNPVLTCLLDLEYPVIKHRQKKDDGVITGIELYETDQKVDLGRVFERLGIQNTWQARASRLNYLYALKDFFDTHALVGENGTLKDFDDKAQKDFDQFIGNYAIADELRKVEEGKNPTTNRQMLDPAQAVIDAIIFTPRDNDATKNVYRVRTTDLNTLDKWHSQKDRNALLTTSLVEDRAFFSQIAEVVHGIVTDAEYKLSSRQFKTPTPRRRQDAINHSAYSLNEDGELVSASGEVLTSGEVSTPAPVEVVEVPAPKKRAPRKKKEAPAEEKAE